MRRSKQQQREEIAEDAIRKAGSIGDLERLAGIADRTAFWMTYAAIKPPGASLDAGCDELKRLIRAKHS